MPKTSEVYSKLYHYTNWEGLQGILKSQSLWATNYQYLNDYTEITLFEEKLIDQAHPHVKQAYEKIIEENPQIKREIIAYGGLEKIIEHDVKGLVKSLYRATGNGIYITSFCGPHKDEKINSNGLLSQWRGYGQDGGVAVVFDTKKLEEIINLEAQLFQYNSIILADLIYSDDDVKFKEELSGEIAKLNEATKLLFRSESLKGEHYPDVSFAYNPFVQCICRYKHYGFSEENEVRIAALPTVFDQELLDLASKDGGGLKSEKEIKYRERNGEQISYVELFSSTDIDLPIEKIIIGPHKEKEMRAKSLRERVGDAIEVTCSEIPFAV